jgi:ribosome assembly protein 4
MRGGARGLGRWRAVDSRAARPRAADYGWRKRGEPPRAAPQSPTDRDPNPDPALSPGPHLDVPSTVTPAQLAALVNGVKGATGADALPYAFSVGGAPLATALGAHLAAAAASVEGAVAVVARPQASFRVRPVSRCAASMPGHSDAVLVAAFSPCGGRLATGSGDATVRLWDLSLHTPAATLTGHAGWVLALAWAPDGSLLASGGADAVVHLWAPARGGPGAAAAGALRGHTKHVTSLAWEPLHAAAAGAGPRLVTGSKDGTARVWCPATRRSLAVLASHRLAVTAVAWGGNNRVYTASRDATINVWDAAAFTLVTTLSGHGHWVNALALSTDAALRTGATDHTGVAPADPGEARAVARKR